MRLKLTIFFTSMIIGLCSCTGNHPKTKHYPVYKGVYSFGPEVKTFKDCDNGQEFWATDSSRQLEVKYAQLNAQKSYVPVYIEVEGIKIHSGNDGLGSDYDSTLVVKKLLKITKVIPVDLCN